MHRKNAEFIQCFLTVTRLKYHAGLFAHQFDLHQTGVLTLAWQRVTFSACTAACRRNSS
jgi:hypothetical protein